MQRKLHPLEGIVAVFALFFVLALAIGFAQAGAGGFYARCGCIERGRVTYRKAPLIYYEMLL